jgi:hypothetical protein
MTKLGFAAANFAGSVKMMARLAAIRQLIVTLPEHLQVNLKGFQVQYHALLVQN